MLWSNTEKEYREKLHAALLHSGFKAGPPKKATGYKHGQFEAWIEISEEKTKARKKVVDEGGEK